uniref:Uncharacterized protein n=1 Tax=Anguilla anguilla TaxID=7936 RepID=A0A0E9PJ18_ANGAN
MECKVNKMLSFSPEWLVIFCTESQII